MNNYLNEQGIKTARGNIWKNTQVFSVLKKYRQRLDRIKNVRQFDHGIEIGKFELKWIKKNFLLFTVTPLFLDTNVAHDFNNFR